MQDGLTPAEPEYLPNERALLTKRAVLREHVGDFVLTDYRLLFRPSDAGFAAHVLGELLHIVHGHRHGTLCRLVRRRIAVLDAEFRHHSAWREAATLATVRPGRDASGLRTPTMLLGFADGRQVEIGVSGSIRAPKPWHPTDARDEMANAIFTQLQNN